MSEIGEHPCNRHEMFVQRCLEAEPTSEMLIQLPNNIGSTLWTWFTMVVQTLLCYMLLECADSNCNKINIDTIMIWVESNIIIVILPIYLAVSNGRRRELYMTCKVDKYQSRREIQFCAMFIPTCESLMSWKQIFAKKICKKNKKCLLRPWLTSWVQ